MNAFDRLWHTLVYGISAAAYLGATLHTLLWFRHRLSRTTSSNERRYLRVAAHTQLALFLSGCLTFTFATAVFVDALTGLTHIPHIAALLTHGCSLVWDAAAILVVLHWVRPQGLTWHIVWLVSTPFALAAIALVAFFFAHSQPHSSVNFVVELGTAWTGTGYLTIFLASILAARIVTLRVVVRELPNVGNRMIRLALYLIACESVLFIVFVAIRASMQGAVLSGHTVDGIDWIPVTLAGIANLVLIAGYTCPDYPGYRTIWRTWALQHRQYRDLYDLWADLTFENTAQAPPRWRDRLAIGDLSTRITARLNDIDDTLASISHDSNVLVPIFIDAPALPTALRDLSRTPSHGEDPTFTLALVYSARKHQLGRPCPDELPVMKAAL